MIEPGYEFWECLNPRCRLRFPVESSDGGLLDCPRCGEDRLHSVEAFTGRASRHWREAGRVKYESVTDDQALDATMKFTREEGILPALETAHAVAWIDLNREKLKGKKIVLCFSGRGDKDMETLVKSRRPEPESRSQ